MNLVGLSLCVVGLLSCALCQDAVIDDNDDEINLDPTNDRIPQQGYGGTETGSRIDTEETNNSEPPDCVCVSFHLCRNNTLNTNGENFLDIRSAQSPRIHCTVEGGKGLYVCCPLPKNKTEVNNNVIQATPSAAIPLLLNKTIISYTEPRISSGCGKRNPDGVGFRMQGSTHNKTEFGEFPWVAAVWMADENPPKSNLTVRCVGSLIHPKVVMTAGHCVRDKSRRHLLRVRLGEWDLYSRTEFIKHQDRVVEKVVIHENYYSGGLHNDVALLFLKDRVKIEENVDMICLADSGANFDSERCIVAGWGALTEKGDGVRYLKQLELPIVPRDSCEQSLRKTERLGDDFELHESFICAGGLENIDTCKGDGGAPLFCPIPGQFFRYQQVGIVSWGVGCGNKGLPALYTNVPLFRKWVDEQMKLHSLEQNTYDI